MLKSTNCNIKSQDGVLYITFPILEKFGVRHCFSTRIGGVSNGKYSAMNLSYTGGDSKESVDENFRRICKVIDADPKNLVFSKQTHTVNIVNISKKGEVVPPDTDGMITNVEGAVLCSSFADCVPLIFYDPIKKVVAASHSGWRGTVGEIGRLTVERMQSDYGCNPQNIVAVIGPSICMDCYEVDDTVITEVNKMSIEIPPHALMVKCGGKYQLDLKELCRLTLIKAGIKDSNILKSDICTCCNSEYLHSHRATGGERGILCSLIYL